MILTKTNLKKLITDAIESKTRWFVDENRPGQMSLSFRITPRILQNNDLLCMLEWRSIAPSGMLWDDEQGSHSVTVSIKSIKTMEDLIKTVADNVTQYMKYPRHIEYKDYDY